MEPSMAYLNCGRCGLEIKIQAAYLRIDNCPRCLARSATVAPMTLSSDRVTPAVAWGPQRSDHRDDPREPNEPLVGGTRGMDQPR